MELTLGTFGENEMYKGHIRNPHTHRTKIVATVGPACDTYEGLLALAQAGVNVFRLNFSHGVYERMTAIISHIRKINEEGAFNVSILGDLQGPKLRIGDIENGVLKIDKGDVLTFTSKEKVMGNRDKIYISYPDLHKDVVVGNKILIDDGKLEVCVIGIDLRTGAVDAEVVHGGLLYPKKGVNLPDTEISLPPLTEKDIADLDFILEKELDWIALSFVRKAEDIIDLKKRITERRSNSKVLAKIEMPSAIIDINNIIRAADGVLIARGDLGVELPVEKVPYAQRSIIRKCIHRGKPVIVATQMMESMITGIRPNRSDITDVANAVMEGADAVMLSAETATGNHPGLVVETMCKIIKEVESSGYYYDRQEQLIPQKHSPTFLSDATCYNACRIAGDLSADAIIGMTQSGYTAFMLSSCRPRSPLFIFSGERWLVNQLSLSWGVTAFYYNNEEITPDAMMLKQISFLNANGYLEQGDIVVSTSGTPVVSASPTNMLRVSRVE
ncbi:pyruvate kinase [Chitinophaga sp. S165]|uniref:pyruvate kinase n=1 Tax=Chitinophaga sp. S165 TaxID=2135462 RepID=UPI000D715585|nr:pyruvate kinase [Chitinophaga sp. S165]PWV55875.1 pyruvate kinase [Chitinophaga sp. S165]